MGFDITGQKFIVTGAAKGIGLAISQRLSQLGAEVAGWDLEKDLMSTEPAFKFTTKVDVTDEVSDDGVARFFFCRLVLALLVLLFHFRVEYW